MLPTPRRARPCRCSCRRSSQRAAATVAATLPAFTACCTSHGSSVRLLLGGAGATAAVPAPLLLLLLLLLSLSGSRSRRVKRSCCRAARSCPSPCRQPVHTWLMVRASELLLPVA